MADYNEGNKITVRKLISDNADTTANIQIAIESITGLPLLSVANYIAEVISFLGDQNMNPASGWLLYGFDVPYSSIILGHFELFRLIELANGLLINVCH